MIKEYVKCPHAEEMGCDDECTHSEEHEAKEYCGGICYERRYKGLITLNCCECKAV